MREVSCKEIKEVVEGLFLEANYNIGSDVKKRIIESINEEQSEIGKEVLKQIAKNHEVASNEKMPICQDTGLAIIFIKLGQEIKIIDGNLNEAIDDAVRDAYRNGCLRKSVVVDPLFNRENTKDNTPAIIHLEIVPGDKLEISITSKGFGGENMSAMRILTPADGLQGVKDFIVNTVQKAGPNACPPVIVGIGIGGTIEKAALIAKQATLRTIGEHNANPKYAELEKELLNDINDLGVGPAGLGGTVTALSVNIEYYPTHISCIPVVVNLCCHANRHIDVII